jgi:hypothetical protein
MSKRENKTRVRIPGPSPLVRSGRLGPLSSGRDDKKKELPEDSKMVLSSPASSFASILVDPKVPYYFRLQTNGAISSNGAGSIITYLNFDPSGISEFTSLATLFNEVRCVSNTLHLNNTNPHSDGYAVGNIKTSIAVACDIGKNSINPSSYDIVLDCPNSRFWPLGCDKTLTMKVTMPKDLNFAATSSPVPNPYAGCYGEWQFYATGLTVSVEYLRYNWVGVYEFRSRT